MALEHRITWSASSHYGFGGATDWEPWDDPTMTHDEIVNELCGGAGQLSMGLELALEASGFAWDVETRELTDRGRSA